MTNLGIIQNWYKYPPHHFAFFLSSLFSHMSNPIKFPVTEHVILTMPEPNILLVTINRQKQYNALSSNANWELHNVFNWAEEEDHIWCIIVSL